MTVGRESQIAGRELVLPPGTHHVELRFDSISLASPEKTRFQYRMDDVDPIWMEADNSLSAVYSNIPVGTHAFRIRASSSDGVWDRSGISFPVTQKPYWYETGWFRFLAAIALVLTLIGAYRFRLQQIRAQMSARLDERVLERTRVARELHDTLLQSFQGLLPHFQAVSNELADVETKQELDKAIDKAARAITEGRDAIQGMRASLVERNDLAESIRALGEELGAFNDAPQPMEFTVQVLGVTRQLHPILRDEVYRIAAEALRNAFRHANALRIEVEIRYDERELRLRVRDDGKGIRPELLSGDGPKGHYGLSGMKERAELVGGKLTVWSGLASGTEVELKIPATHAYTTATRRSWLPAKLSGKDRESES